jgi:hypothetical protein
MRGEMRSGGQVGTFAASIATGFVYWTNTLAQNAGHPQVFDALGNSGDGILMEIY